jgi:hypothetical protein
MVKVGSRLSASANTGGDEIDIGLRLPRRDAGFEARHDVEVLAAALVLPVDRERERQQKFGLLDAADRGDDLVIEQEPGTKDADHRELFAAEIEAAADDLRIGAEEALPQGVGQDGDRRFSGLVVLRLEQAAKERTGAEHVQKAGGGAYGFDPLRLGGADQVQAIVDGERHLFRSDSAAEIVNWPGRPVLGMDEGSAATGTRRSGSGYGNGLSRRASATLKTAVLAPIPTASESTMTSVSAGLLVSMRVA